MILVHDNRLLQVEHQPNSQRADSEHYDHVEILGKVAKHIGSNEVADHLRAHVEGPKVGEEKKVTWLMSMSISSKSNVKKFC